MPDLYIRDVFLQNIRQQCCQSPCLENTSSFVIRKLKRKVAGYLLYFTLHCSAPKAGGPEGSRTPPSREKWPVLDRKCPFSDPKMPFFWHENAFFCRKLRFFSFLPLPPGVGFGGTDPNTKYSEIKLSSDFEYYDKFSISLLSAFSQLFVVRFWWNQHCFWKHTAVKKHCAEQ